MSLSLNWLTKDSAEAIGRTRALCYAPTTKEIEIYQQRLAKDGRVTGEDILLAYRDNQPVGTATSYSMSMWIRGQSFPCQGVAWVGTVKTHRRSGGVATQIMRECRCAFSTTPA
jgi:predicted acetyltransferase